jgi:apolipoprotein N-acyltransferase
LKAHLRVLNRFKFSFPYLLGALAVFGFAPFYIFPSTILSLIGLCYLWLQTSSAKAAFWLGFQYGLGLFVIGIYWIYISLHDFGGMPWWFAGFCTFCLCAFMALFTGLVGWFSKKLNASFSYAPLLSIPVLWGLSDWIRSWIFTGFPWLTIGYSQVPYSPLAGYIPVVGVYGVSVITVFLSALIAYWFTKPSLTFKRYSIAAIVFIIVVGNVLKIVQWTTPIGKPISVALLQGNTAQDIKWSPETALGTIKQYIEMVQNSKAQLTVLPETALPVIVSQLDQDVKDALAVHAKENNGDLIVGMVEYNETADSPSGEYFNSALTYGNSPTQSYKKNHLVPFGEFIPLKQVFGWIYRDWLNIPLSDLSRGGTHQTPMHLANQKVAVNICYEDVFGEEIIRQLPEATLLVNISNDAWYGQSIAAYQHMQFSQARALETGRMVLRATNTGATAIIDPQGYVLAHALHDTKTILTGQALGYQGSTPYVRWGNWPFIVFSLSTIAFLIRRKRL